jgi:hypothetical protein
MPILTGADYQRDIRLLKQSDKSPVDLTGFALQLCIKAQRGDAQALLVLTLGSGLTVADPTTGTITLAMTAAQTTAIGVGSRVWGLYRTDGDRRVAIATGQMRVQQGI